MLHFNLLQTSVSLQLYNSELWHYTDFMKVISEEAIFTHIS